MSDGSGDGILESIEVRGFQTKFITQALVRLVLASAIISLGIWLVSSWMFAIQFKDAVIANFLAKIGRDFIEFGVPGAMSVATLLAGISVLKTMFISRVKMARSNFLEEDENPDSYLTASINEELVSAHAEKLMLEKAFLNRISVDDAEYGPFRPEISELDQIKSRSGVAEKSALLFTAMRVRLIKDEVRLRGNSRLNLMIGVFVALVAASIMGSPLFISKEIPSSISEFWSAYMLRLPVGILLQVVSFFFLRLYVATENEIKHNKNEVTNIESKFLSLIASREFGHSPEFSIRSLAETERNFVIRRGEKTVGSENDSKYNDIKSILEKIIEVVPSTYASGKPQ